MNQGLDIEKIAAEAKAYVAGLSDADVRRKLTDKKVKEEKKKAKVARDKALKKAIEAAITLRGALIGP